MIGTEYRLYIVKKFPKSYSKKGTGSPIKYDYPVQNGMNDLVLARIPIMFT